MAVEDSVAQDQLRAFIERIERMEEEKASVAADIKEIYAEAKGNGFDTKILRKIVTIRKQDANERMEQEALLDLYMGALGMGGDVSSAYAETRRNSIAEEIDEDLLTTVAETAKTPEGRKALMDAVAAHKNGSRLSQLRADPAMAIVEAANITPKTQPTKAAGQVQEDADDATGNPSDQLRASLPGAEGAEDRETITEPQPSQPAGSDLTSLAPHEGQAAPIPAAVEGQRSTPVIDVGDSGEAIQPETANELPKAAGATIQSDQPDARPEASPEISGKPEANKYAKPGVVTWESTPPEGVQRHPYSHAFGTLGQDAVVIADDIAMAKAAPVVKIGNVILDGWARYMTARGAVGLDGHSTEYPVVQYDGSDPLIDCIKWNVAGRVLSPKDKQTIVARLSAIEPKRKADIIKAVAELAA